ncbi:MAG: Crp/Fnr family transcriptional regulator [Limnohabitans sp.]
MDTTNGVFTQLDPEERKALAAVCQPVELQAGQTLSSPALPRPEVHFPLSATVVSLIETADGQGLALGLCGREGVVGLSYALGLGPGLLSLQVQTGGQALRADAHALASLMSRQPRLLLVFMRQLCRQQEEAAVAASRAQSHDIEARLANWLCLSAERAGTLELALTQQHLARMLGVRRVSVTLAAHRLRDAGLIDYRRGTLRVSDPSGLRRRASKA